MDTALWGDAGWKFLYAIALNYPDRPDYDVIQHYKQFFTSLQYVLPCEKCKLHFSNILQSNPIDPYLVDSDALIEWILLVDNKVRKDNGKDPQTTDQVLKKHFGSVENAQKLLWKPTDAEGVEMFKSRKTYGMSTTGYVLIGLAVAGSIYYIHKTGKMKLR